MSLKDRIATDLKTAMKAQDKFRTGVLRMMLSEIKYAEAALRGDAQLSHDDCEKIVATYFKRLDKSQKDFPEGEARQKVSDEMQVVSEYLPKKVGKDEVEAAVDELLGKTEERQFGVLMKELIQTFGRSADGKLLSQVLKERLG